MFIMVIKSSCEAHLHHLLNERGRSLKSGEEDEEKVHEKPVRSQSKIGHPSISYSRIGPF